MTFYNINRLLQAAVANYIETNAETYLNGVAASLPVYQAGDFIDLGEDHILVFVSECNEDPAFSGTYAANLMVRICTLRETTGATHGEYCQAVFGLLSDTDLPALINAADTNNVRINQYIEGKSFTVGIVNESMRHDTMELQLRVYQA